MEIDLDILGIFLMLPPSCLLSEMTCETHGPSFSSIPSGSLVQPGFPWFSSEAMLTSAGPQETFNLASFLELRERKWAHSKDQGETKRPFSFRRRDINGRRPTIKGIQAKSLWFQTSRKFLNDWEIKCLLYAMYMFRVWWPFLTAGLTLCPLSQVTTLRMIHLTMIPQLHLTFDLLPSLYNPHHIEN